MGQLQYNNGDRGMAIIVQPHDLWLSHFHFVGVQHSSSMASPFLVNNELRQTAAQNSKHGAGRLGQPLSPMLHTIGPLLCRHSFTVPQRGSCREAAPKVQRHVSMTLRGTTNLVASKPPRVAAALVLDEAPQGHRQHNSWGIGSIQWLCTGPPRKPSPAILRMLLALLLCGGALPPKSGMAGLQQWAAPTS